MTKAFDPSTLKPGDEVGIERCVDGKWATWSAGRVAWIHDDLIELEGDEWYWRDGRKAYSFSAFRFRLAAPTDEGRWAALQETVATDLDVLADQSRSMDLAELRRLKAWIDAKGWDDACAS